MPRVAQGEIDDRRRAMTALLRDRSYLPVAALCRRFKISEATARRDLTALSKDKSVVRTFGGAMADYDRRFAPFADRLRQASAAKARIAEAAVRLIRPGTTVFLDAGTTLFAVAERLRRWRNRPADLRIVTSSLAVAERLARLDGVAVHLLGGQLLANQSVLLGREACRAAAGYRIDLAFIGAEAVDATGAWNSVPDVVALQRAVIDASRRHALCVDRHKVGRSAPSLLIPWPAADLMVTDLDADSLHQAGIPLTAKQVIQA